ncbi:MAG: serine/threonine-protein kinase, partial [Bryobacteraceae bacterium]
MDWLSDLTLERLRQAASRPDLSETRYRIVEEIGRGGMGTVYAAEDAELDRQVAIKVLNVPDPDGHAASRMRREARILAQLEHPGIVPVHDVGTLPDGRVYYAMKLVRGVRLDRFCGTSRPLPDLLRVFVRICETVAFAHANQVVHRDLKPENIMIGGFGEVLVMDWGVAKLLREGGVPRPSGPAVAGQTADGAIVGTPEYMSPEQASGASSLVGPRSDIYSLGCILDLLLRCSDDPGTRPLQSIVDKAAAADPAARYQAAAEIRAEIERFLNGERVSAHRETLLDGTLRLASRHKPILLL